MSRLLRYQVAASLDGFIAGPNGEYDWIVMDPSIDFNALFKEFDTAVMGRKTHEVLMSHGGNGAVSGLDTVVFSRTLPATVQKGVRIVSDDAREVVAALKAQTGRDIWLFGGGALLRSLLDAGLVDTVEVAVMPVLLGRGIPLLAEGASAKLALVDRKILPASGIVMLSYRVAGRRGRGVRIRYIKARKAVARKSASTRSAKTTRTSKKTALARQRAMKTRRRTRRNR
jgi:dihydrofolate reductase